MQKSIGIGQKVLYINGKKHTTSHYYYSGEKNDTKYIMLDKNLTILPRNQKTLNYTQNCHLKLDTE